MEYYHVSKDANLTQLTPRIPRKVAVNEDSATPRCCFAPSVVECLLSMGEENTIYYVYKAEDFNVYKPSIEQVIDSEYTNEVWSLHPVNVKFLGEIYTYEPVDVLASYQICDRIIDILIYPYEWTCNMDDNELELIGRLEGKFNDFIGVCDW